MANAQIRDMQAEKPLHPSDLFSAFPEVPPNFGNSTSYGLHNAWRGKGGLLHLEQVLLDMIDASYEGAFSSKSLFTAIHLGFCTIHES